MRWILVGVLVATAGCGAILAPEPRADEGLEKYYGGATPEADEEMQRILREERVVSDLEEVHERLEEGSR